MGRFPPANFRFWNSTFGAMARRGGSPLKRREALNIAQKLGAETKPRTNHDLVLVRFEKRLVATFCIRRGTHSGHGHVPSQLFISESDAMRLAACTLSKDKYFRMIADKLY